MNTNILYYIHDPMCSWCWGFRKTWKSVKQSIPNNISIENLLGGLAEDTQEPMAIDLQKTIKNTWRQIQQSIPGTEFNFNFWDDCIPRRSTYPSCRAVIAARIQNKETEMLFGIQQAYYLNARNPSDKETLMSIANSLGLNINQFTADLESSNKQLFIEIEQSRELGVYSFPSLVLKHNNELHTIKINYNHPDNITQQIQSLL